MTEPSEAAAYFNREWFQDKYGIMVAPTESANVAVHIVEALMSKLSDRDIAKMDLVENVLNHCLYSFASIIERHTTGLREENDLLKQKIEEATEERDEYREQVEIMAVAGHEHKIKTHELIERLKQQLALFIEAEPDCERCNDTGKIYYTWRTWRGGWRTNKETSPCPDCNRDAEATNQEGGV